jgi:hypothetical protein
MAKLTNPIDDVVSRSVLPQGSQQEINCQTAENFDTKKILPSLKSKTSLKSGKSKSPKKSTSRYGKKKLNETNTSRLS